MAAPTDAELIRGILAGDTAAERSLWERYRGRVRFFILRRLRGDDAAAQDLEQDVFVALLLAVREGRLTETGNAGAYVYKISSNLTTRWTQHTRRSLPLGDTAALRSREEDPEAIHLEKEAHERLRRLMASMGDAERRLLVLRFGEEWSYRKIAAELNLKEDAVRQRVCRAVAALRKGLTETG
ncbi:sigma-70 family RNA polymerase sigma factor [Candidatus Fermentibacteria bacterium]|nr:sigma-70 family RNA polymerase sigma factor [Candidatus Fermentibacteria bacterium]